MDFVFISTFRMQMEGRNEILIRTEQWNGKVRWPPNRRVLSTYTLREATTAKLVVFPEEIYPIYQCTEQTTENKCNPFILNPARFLMAEGKWGSLISLTTNSPVTGSWLDGRGVWWQGDWASLQPIPISRCEWWDIVQRTFNHAGLKAN